MRPPDCPPIQRTVFLLAAAAILLLRVPIRAAEITLPQETTRFVESPLPGYPLATELCSTCHSVEYVQSQPPSLTHAYWTATVTKMQKTFGAAIPVDSVDPLVDFLVKTYGAERTSPPAPARPIPASQSRPGTAP